MKTSQKKVRRIGGVVVNYTSERLFPNEIAKYLTEHGERLMDEDILMIMRATDELFVKRFGDGNHPMLRREGLCSK